MRVLLKIQFLGGGGGGGGHTKPIYREKGID